MGGFSSVSDTQFVGTDELGAVTSFQPCHLFGDSTLIGLGIRLAFYLLYGAAFIAVPFGLDATPRFWNGSWTAVALATFVALTINATSSNTAGLIVIDWAILIQLVLWYPVFFVVLLLTRRVLTASPSPRQKIASVEDIRIRLEAQRRRLVSAQDAARARAYADALKAFAAQASDPDNDGLAADLASALSHFVSLWPINPAHERHPRASNPTPADDTDHNHNTAAILLSTTYPPSAIAEIAAAPSPSDVRTLRDTYISALLHGPSSPELADLPEARAAERLAAGIAAQEMQIKNKGLSPMVAVRDLLYTAPARDKLAVALAMLVWAAYMLVTPWLYTSGMDRGRKAECDASVKLLFVLAPISPFVGSGFKTFLIIFASGSVIIAAFLAFFAIFLLTVGIFGSRARGKGKYKPGKKGEKGDDRQRRAEEEMLREIRVAGEYDPEARRQHGQEILLALFDHFTLSTSKSNSNEGRHGGWRGKKKRSKSVARPVYFTASNIPWAIILLILLAETIATVEETVIIDQLDFIVPPMHGTAEILAFLIGALALFIVLWSIVAGWVVARRMRKSMAELEKRGNTRRNSSEFFAQPEAAAAAPAAP
jgi:hypothetical protein